MVWCGVGSAEHSARAVHIIPAQPEAPTSRSESTQPSNRAVMLLASTSDTHGGRCTPQSHSPVAAALPPLPSPLLPDCRCCLTRCTARFSTAAQIGMVLDMASGKRCKCGGKEVQLSMGGKRPQHVAWQCHATLRRLQPPYLAALGGIDQQAPPGGGRRRGNMQVEPHCWWVSGGRVQVVVGVGDMGARHLTSTSAVLGTPVEKDQLLLCPSVLLK